VENKMTRWKIITEYGNGNIIDTVEGSFDRASDKRDELSKKYGAGLILSPSL